MKHKKLFISRQHRPKRLTSSAGMPLHSHLVIINNHLNQQQTNKLDNYLPLGPARNTQWGANQLLM